jgi:hypothetical protein
MFVITPFVKYFLFTEISNKKYSFSSLNNFCGIDNKGIISYCYSPTSNYIYTLIKRDNGSWRFHGFCDFKNSGVCAENNTLIYFELYESYLKKYDYNLPEFLKKIKEQDLKDFDLIYALDSRWYHLPWYIDWFNFYYFNVFGVRTMDYYQDYTLKIKEEFNTDKYIIAGRE